MIDQTHRLSITKQARILSINRGSVYYRAEASVSLVRYIDGFYNAERPHSSLDRKTHDKAYFNLLPGIQQEA
jgi:hypothetical protein